MPNPKTRGPSSVSQREHHETAAAKRVVTMPNGGTSVAYEDTSFTSGKSPAILDVVTDLGRLGIQGSIKNDGTGNILVEFSDDGSTYGGQHTVKDRETLVFDALNVNRIRLSHSGTDSSYRVMVV